MEVNWEYNSDEDSVRKAVQVTSVLGELLQASKSFTEVSKSPCNLTDISLGKDVVRPQARLRTLCVRTASHRPTTINA